MLLDCKDLQWRAVEGTGSRLVVDCSRLQVQLEKRSNQ